MAKKIKDETTEEITEPIYIPDIPAQMEPVEQKPDSDEVIFLLQLLHRQHEGGFGHHLDNEINERIKYLRECL
jgi:hypothetical protein